MLVLCLVVCLPALGGAFRAALAGAAPIADEGAIQTWALDSGTSRTPLVGMPSTASPDGEIRHPGPLHFWLLAAPVRVLRALTDSAASLFFAQALVNSALLGLAVASVALATRRRSVMLLATAAAVLTLWGGGAPTAFAPYNPSFAFVALLAASLAAYATIRAPSSTFPPIVLFIAASAAAQAHLSYAFPALGLFMTGAIVVLRRRPSRQRFAIMLGVIVACWLGPILDMVLHRGGNLLGYLAATPEAGERTGIVRSVERAARSLAPWDLGMQRGGYDSATLLDPPSAVTWVFAGMLMLTVASGWKHRVLRTPSIGVLSVVLLTLLGLAIAPFGFAVAFAPHMVRLFALPAALVLALAIATCVMHVRSARLSVPRRWATPVTVGAVAALTLVAGSPLIFSSARTFQVETTCTHAVRVLAAAGADAVDGRRFNLDATQIELKALFFESFVAIGLYSELVARGNGGRIVGTLPIGYFAPSRLVPDRNAPRQLVLLTGGLKPSGTATLLAIVSGSSCGRSTTGAPETELALWMLD